MAFNLGDILVNIKANTTGLKQGISDVQGMGEQTKTLGQKIQTGMNVAAAGLAVVGAGLTIYAKNATDFVVDTVKGAKQLATTIGTTTTEASRLTAALGRMGISADDARQMFGIFSKQIVSSTTNSEANRLATQKLQIQIDSTKLSIKQVTEEIAKNGDKTGDLHLKLLDLNNTLATQQNSLRSSADSFAKLGISTTDTGGKQKDFNTILFEVADKFKAMPDGVDKTTIAMSLFGRSGKDMIKTLNLGSDGIKDLETQADKLGLTLTEKTIGSVAKLVASQKDLKQQTDAIKIAVGTLTAPVLTEYNTWLGKILTTIMNVNPQMKNLTGHVLAFGGPVASASSAVVGFLGNIGSIGPGLAAFLLDLLPWVIAIAAIGAGLYELQKHFGIFDDLGGKIERVWQSFNNLYGITTVVSQFWNQVMWPALQAIWAAVDQNLRPALEQLWGALMRLWNALQPGLVDVLKILAVVAGAVLFAAIWLALGALNILIQIFSILVSGVSNVINWIANLIAWFGNLAGVVWNTLKIIGDIIWHLPQAFKDVFAVVVQLFSGFGGMILRAMGNLGSLLYNAGKDLIQGLINGVNDMVNNVKNAVGNVGSSAVSKMKSILGIHSPSTVFSDIGGNIGEGMIQGIMSRVNDVKDAMNTMLAPVGIPALAGAALNTGSMLTANQAQDPGSNSSTTTNNPTFKTEITGPVTIASPGDAEYYLGLQDRNQDLELMGMSPATMGGR